MNNIGQKIKECRELLKITQEELGKACGTTKQTIFKYESGIVTNIPMDRLERIAAALKVTPAWLMGWNDDDPAEDTDALMAALERAFNERPEMRTLFSIAEKATADDVEKTIKILETLRGE